MCLLFFKCELVAFMATHVGIFSYSFFEKLLRNFTFLFQLFFVRKGDVDLKLGDFGLCVKHEVQLFERPPLNGLILFGIQDAQVFWGDCETDYCRVLEDPCGV